jgi:hypothetical protein
MDVAFLGLKDHSQTGFFDWKIGTDFAFGAPVGATVEALVGATVWLGATEAICLRGEFVRERQAQVEP